MEYLGGTLIDLPRLNGVQQVASSNRAGPTNGIRGAYRTRQTALISAGKHPASRQSSSRGYPLATRALARHARLPQPKDAGACRVGRWRALPDSKSGDGLAHPWVRIPPSPPIRALRDRASPAPHPGFPEANCAQRGRSLPEARSDSLLEPGFGLGIVEDFVRVASPTPLMRS